MSSSLNAFLTAHPAPSTVPCPERETEWKMDLGKPVTQTKEPKLRGDFTPFKDYACYCVEDDEELLFSPGRA